jgi:hypothetical protein
MGIGRFFNAYKTKLRFAQAERKWTRSARGQEIDAERDLPPRPLTPEEHDVLVWILEHGSEEAKSFLPQVEGIRAVRACPCGCPTIRLEVVEGVPLGSSQASNVICDLWGRTAKGELVGVLVFQNAGKLSEMEAYSVDGEIQGESQEFSFPKVESMRELGGDEPPAATLP